MRNIIATFIWVSVIGLVTLTACNHFKYSVGDTVRAAGEAGAPCITAHILKQVENDGQRGYEIYVDENQFHGVVTEDDIAEHSKFCK